ncbi:unnamed protein product [Owenia fusiformis]|uniref:Uncharacterized protein n=1 Tax=Owenia fusiformis TaxID=6347 RepID=A0A8J1UX39_OWEFU|nr:unnamed protein product [Owenia fusiformis]
MAEEEIEQSEDVRVQKKVGKHDDGAADLEKVTDYVEEAEISPQNISDAMKVMNERKARELQEKQTRERELSQVKINKDDVELIVNEMEISRTLAERKLREHGGNAVEALIELTN